MQAPYGHCFVWLSEAPEPKMDPTVATALQCLFHGTEVVAFYN